MKKVVYTESIHQWKGIAIVREDGTIVEKDLGVKLSEKRLQESGAKELFSELPVGTITIEVTKLEDIKKVYELEAEEFKTIATIKEDVEEVEENK